MGKFASLRGVDNLPLEGGDSQNQDQLNGHRAAKSRNNHQKGPRSKVVDALLGIAFIFGLLVFLYPTISNYVNSLHQGRAIAAYDQSVAAMSPADFDAEWRAVADYNRDLIGDRNRWHPNQAHLDRYNSILNVGGSHVMGHIEIQKLRVTLPIYHSVDDSVLQVGVGHIPGTSLPGGGNGSHVVLSGHRGLPTSKLFTDLDQLTEGDQFVLHVLDQSLTYEVDQIRVVEPSELQTLEIFEDQDLVTLTTCTPYAINTHRLLVRGHRIEADNSDYIAADAVTLDRILVSSVLAVPIFVILFIALIGSGAKRKRNTQ